MEAYEIFYREYVTSERCCIVNLAGASRYDLYGTLRYGQCSQIIDYVIIRCNVVSVFIKDCNTVARKSVLGLSCICLRAIHLQIERMNIHNARNRIVRCGKGSAVIYLLGTACSNRYGTLKHCQSTDFIGDFIVFRYVVSFTVEYLDGFGDVGVFYRARICQGARCGIRYSMSGCKIICNKACAGKGSSVVRLRCTARGEYKVPLGYGYSSRSNSYLVFLVNVVAFLVNYSDRAYFYRADRGSRQRLRAVDDKLVNDYTVSFLESTVGNAEAITGYCRAVVFAHNVIGC